MEATINPQILVFKEISCNRDFLIYTLQTSLVKYQVELSVIGGTIPTISQSKILNYLIPCPPIEEQSLIANAIENEINPIEEAIEGIEKLIANLLERKQIIINDVVTGKVKVTA